MERQIAYYTEKLEFEIDAWDLEAMLDRGDAVTVVDARGEGAFREEHIAGAINVPHRTISDETTAHLDREALVVTYCDGIGCNASTRAALRMAQLGFRTKELIGGIAWWKRDGHPVDGTRSGLTGEGCACG
jgi:rhodanese-related sulfurtransferase